jgi:hypothetical protein
MSKQSINQELINLSIIFVNTVELKFQNLNKQFFANQDNDDYRYHMNLFSLFKEVSQEKQIPENLNYFNYCSYAFMVADFLGINTKIGVVFHRLAIIKDDVKSDVFLESESK